MNRAERRKRQKQAAKAAPSPAGGGRPGLAEALTLARQHLGAGRVGAAEQVYRQILQAAPGMVEALHHLGVIAVQKGDTAQGIQLMTHALRHAPDAVEILNDLGVAHKRLGDHAAALDAFTKVLEHRPDMPQAHTNLGNVLLAMGRVEDARDHFERVRDLTPDAPSAHYNLGVAFQDLGAWEQATACYERVLALDSGHAAARVNLGTVFEAQDRLIDAEGAYHAAVASDPGYAHAHHGLMDVLDRTNQTQALADAVAAAGAAVPGHRVVALGRARLLKRQGDLVRARDALEDVRKSPNGDDADPIGTDAAYLLGDVCDRLGDYEAAFAAFSDANARLKNDAFDPAGYRHDIERVAAHFTQDWAGSWSGGDDQVDDRADPVFLVGFPRSGTTLLDTILRSHGAFAVVEEQPLMFHARQGIITQTGTYPEGLASLNDDQVRDLRAAYFQELDAHVDGEGPVIVDKFPLNLAEAGLIHRLFPRARFLLALRHPCDCVLSGFMQNFALNDAMANFLDIDTAAQLYDTTMEAWTRYVEVLGLKVHAVRYEDVVADFEGTIGKALGFLDVTWNEGVTRYTETARQRHRINTPSYDQVTQPIYTRASGRWGHYRHHMEPVLKHLAPWAERFGYDL